MYVISHKNFNFHTSDKRYQHGLVHVPASNLPQPIPEDVEESVGFKLALKDGAISIVEGPPAAVAPEAEEENAGSGEQSDSEDQNESETEAEAEETSADAASPAPQITQEHADFFASRGYPAGESIEAATKKLKKMSKRDRASFFAEFDATGRAEALAWREKTASERTAADQTEEKAS